ncbi:MAG: protein kinase [Polyangiaceae bacterium]
MSTSLEPGDVIKGKYTVERVIGEGGMGVVVAAFHAELEAHVAIKVLNEDVMANPQVVERFEREARAAVKIKSRHVARVTDVGKLLGGRPYMVMEYLEGNDLEAVMLKEESLPVVRAVDYVLQACDAIAEAHAYGIVHRDLKPGNLFLAHQADGSKEIKVLDFGISKSTNPRAPEKGITSATEIFGSAMYMSPEQLTASANVDARADIWSLGIILYELLTGNPPFHEGTVAEIWSGILHKEIERPSKRRATIPAGLESAIMKCLARDLDARFQHVADLAEAIAPFGTGDAQACVDRAARFRARTAASPSASGEKAPPAPRAPMQSLINVDIDWDDAAPGATPSAPPGSSPKPRPKSMRPPAATPSDARVEKARTTTDWQSVAPPRDPRVVHAAPEALAVAHDRDRWRRRRGGRRDGPLSERANVDGRREHPDQARHECDHQAERGSPHARRLAHRGRRDARAHDLRGESAAPRSPPVRETQSVRRALRDALGGRIRAAQRERRPRGGGRW